MEELAVLAGADLQSRKGGMVSRGSESDALKQKGLTSSTTDGSRST